MKSILTSVIALLIAASTALAQFTINTPPAPVQCQPLLVSWMGGVPPYFLTIYPGGDPQGTPLETFPEISGTSATWFCNLQANTQIGFNLRDSTGTLVQSAAVLINAPPPGTTCDTTTFSFSAQTPVGGSTATGTNGSPATTTTPSTQTSTTGSLSSGSVKSGASSSVKAGASSSGAAATATKSAGASRATGQIAAAGIIGAAMVALFG